jgi:hypothetical protein
MLRTQVQERGGELEASLGPAAGESSIPGALWAAGYAGQRPRKRMGLEFETKESPLCRGGGSGQHLSHRMCGTRRLLEC